MYVLYTYRICKSARSYIFHWRLSQRVMSFSSPWAFLIWCLQFLCEKCRKPWAMIGTAWGSLEQSRWRRTLVELCPSEPFWSPWVFYYSRMLSFPLYLFLSPWMQSSPLGQEKKKKKEIWKESLCKSLGLLYVACLHHRGMARNSSCGVTCWDQSWKGRIRSRHR